MYDIFRRKSGAIGINNAPLPLKRSIEYFDGGGA